jgi:Probable cobalt transporter subunit (CbtA)
MARSMNPTVFEQTAQRVPIALGSAGTWWLVASASLSLVIDHFVGVDQGALSVFGNDMHITSSCTTDATCSPSPATEPAWSSDSSSAASAPARSAVCSRSSLLPAVRQSPPPRDPPGYPGFPRELLLQFRLCAIAAQAILWARIGLVFGALVERLPSEARAPRAERTADALIP